MGEYKVGKHEITVNQRTYYVADQFYSPRALAAETLVRQAPPAPKPVPVPAPAVPINNGRRRLILED